MLDVLEQFYNGISKIYPKLKQSEKNVSESHLCEIEKQLGFELNPELKEWFKIIGDAKYGVDGFLAGMEIYSVDEMLTEWKGWREFDNDEELQNLWGLSSTPEGAIRCRYTNPKWIMLAHDYCSNYIGVDLDPDKNGVVGQVINFGRDEDKKRVFANSIEEYLNLLIKYQNEMTILEEDNGDYYINDEEIHAIDWLKKKVDE